MSNLLSVICNCLSVFDHFAGLTLNGLKLTSIFRFIHIPYNYPYNL